MKEKIKTLKDLRRMWITKFEPEDSETDIELSEFEITAKGRMGDFVDTVNWEEFCKNKKVPTILLDYDLRQEAIKIFKNLQSSDTIYPLILDKLPKDCKGSYAKDKWNDSLFRYGTEYGMLAMLYWLMNLNEDDLQ